MQSLARSSSQSSFSAARSETVPRHNVTSRIVSMLWTDGQIMDSFRNKGRGWQSAIATRLGVTRDDLSAFIKATGGLDQLRDVVFGNPAGPAPQTIDFSKIPQHMTESYGCGTSGCATTACGTAHCGTYMCGTYACGNLPAGPGTGKPDIA